jgi:hypothetical protein
MTRTRTTRSRWALDARTRHAPRLLCAPIPVPRDREPGRFLCRLLFLALVAAGWLASGLVSIPRCCGRRRAGRGPGDFNA